MQNSRFERQCGWKYYQVTRMLYIKLRMCGYQYREVANVELLLSSLEWSSITSVYKLEIWQSDSKKNYQDGQIFKYCANSNLRKFEKLTEEGELSFKSSQVSNVTNVLKFKLVSK